MERDCVGYDGRVTEPVLLSTVGVRDTDGITDGRADGAADLSADGITDGTEDR